MTIDRVEDFQIGRVVSRTFGVLTRNAVTFLALAGVLTVPILLTTFYYTRNNPLLNAADTPAARAAALTGQFGTFFTTTMATLFITVVFGFVLQAALVQGTISDLNGERTGLGNLLSTGIKNFLPLVAIAILTTLGMMAGFVLLIVPGIMLALMWAVVVPVKVVEHTGIMESFGRSRALTAGHRWKIFGLVLIYVLIAWLIQLVVALLAGTSLVRPNLAALSTAYLVASWVVKIPLTALAAVGIAAIYYELRLVKEGVGPAQLAAAFD